MTDAVEALRRAARGLHQEARADVADDVAGKAEAVIDELHALRRENGRLRLALRFIGSHAEMVLGLAGDDGEAGR